MTSKLRVGVVKAKSQTGVQSFLDTFWGSLSLSERCQAEWVDLSSCSKQSLNSYDVLYFPYLQIGNVIHFGKLLGSRIPRVLTIHGWVYEEAWDELRSTSNPLVKLRKLLTMVIYWMILKLRLFDIVTAPSPVTREKMGGGSIEVLSNAIAVEATPAIELKTGDEPLLFLAYSGIGGGKHLSIAPLIEVFREVFVRSSRALELHVFGEYGGL